MSAAERIGLVTTDPGCVPVGMGARDKVDTVDGPERYGNRGGGKKIRKKKSLGKRDNVAGAANVSRPLAPSPFATETRAGTPGNMREGGAASGPPAIFEFHRQREKYFSPSAGERISL